MIWKPQEALICTFVWFSAMINAGMGASHINTFLAGLEIPFMCAKTIRRRELEIAHTIEAVAVESCNAALHEEIRISQQREE